MNVHGSVICNSPTETNINPGELMVCLHTGILFSNTKEQTIEKFFKKPMNLRTVMLNEGSQMYDNCMHMIPHRILQNANLSRNLRKQIRGRLGMGGWGPGGWVAGGKGAQRRQERRITKVDGETLRVMDMFNVVMVLRYLQMLKLTKRYTLSMCILLYVNYIKTKDDGPDQVSAVHYTMSMLMTVAFLSFHFPLCEKK